MSGHSKWSTIKRKKEKTDAQRAKVFTKVGREIEVCVREGGPDPGVNGKLRDLIAKAKSMNVPNDNINRIIKRAEGGEKDDYETILYEGYGPSGIAVMVSTLTDNRNRTAANIRHYFDKYGGNMGQSGSVAFQFTQKGIILIEGEALNEEKLMEDAFEAGANDLDMDDGLAEITCEPAKVHDVSRVLAEKGYTIASSEVEYVSASQAPLTSEADIKKMSLLLEHLEEDDDVQNVWHNLQNPEVLDI